MHSYYIKDENLAFTKLYDLLVIHTPLTWSRTISILPWKWQSADMVYTYDNPLFLARAATEITETEQYISLLNTN